MSYSQGYNHTQEFIASQGPVPGTVIDFWRMVWEYDIPTIVMVTNLFEKMKKKCAQYWPHSGSASYGPYTVTLVATTSLTNFVIRDLTIKNVRMHLRI